MEAVAAPRGPWPGLRPPVITPSLPIPILSFTRPVRLYYSAPLCALCFRAPLTLHAPPSNRPAPRPPSAHSDSRSHHPPNGSHRTHTQTHLPSLYQRLVRSVAAAVPSVASISRTHPPIQPSHLLPFFCYTLLLIHPLVNTTTLLTPSTPTFPSPPSPPPLAPITPASTPPHRGPPPRRDLSHPRQPTFPRLITTTPTTPSRTAGHRAQPYC
jgi:hypothetical protein